MDKEKQREEFKTQIRADKMTFTFETDDIIVWHLWAAVIVQQYVTMTSEGTSSGRGSSWSKGSSWGQGTFDGSVSDSDGSPYG